MNVLHERSHSPYYFDEIGREIFLTMKTGRLKIKGMIS